MRKFISFTLVLALAFSLATVTVDAEEKEYGFELTIMSALYTPKDLNSEWWIGAQEMLDTKLNVEFVPVAEYDTKMELLISSDNVPEMMSIEGASNLNLLNAINNGYFWDIKPYVGENFENYPNMRDNIPRQAWAYLSNNGGYYRIPRPRALINTTSLIRTDWFERAGYTDTQIMTIEEVTDALEKICNGDYDGNGLKDTIGIYFTEEYASLFGAWDLELNEDGKILPLQLSPAYADMVGWFAELYAKGCVSPELAVITDGQADEMLKTGRMAMKWKNTWHCYTMSNEAEKVQPGATIRTLPVITNGDYICCRFDPGFVGAIVISKKVPEDRMLKMLEYINKTLDKEFAQYVQYGIEGVHHTVVDGKKVLTELGTTQIQNDTNVTFAIYCDEWFKVDSPTAPEEFNQMIRDRSQIMYEYGRVNPWQIIRSDTWSSEWPVYQQDFESTRVKAITGAITMDEFRAYQQQLLNEPFVSDAIEEFTASRNEFFPNGNVTYGGSYGG